MSIELPFYHHYIYKSDLICKEYSPQYQNIVGMFPGIFKD